eukprot:2774583-Amphidinium_carterae.2
MAMPIHLQSTQMCKAYCAHDIIGSVVSLYLVPTGWFFSTAHLKSTDETKAPQNNFQTERLCEGVGLGICGQ